MTIVLDSVVFLAAMACAALMGFAVQRGATCTVAAVHEVVAERRFSRLAALVEAAFWVAAGLLAAEALHLMPKLPAGLAITRWTVVGSMLLGIGAWINGACIVGAVARLGSGEWAYAATPIGFYLGCLSVAAVFGPHTPQALAGNSPLLRASAGLALLFVAFATWRVATAWRRHRAHPAPASWHRALLAHAWSPHGATTVIAIAFVALLLLIGAWAYTDVLAELARGMAANLAARTLLLAALLLGAIAGGWSAGCLRRTPISRRRVLLCTAGGVLMGWGSLLLPGGNDGLVLLAMPLAWPYAWLAFATMCATIAAAQVAARRIAAARAAPAHGTTA
jgi:toxin CptA